MKKAIILIVVIFWVFVILIFAKDTIAKGILIGATRHMVGLDVRVNNIQVGLLKPYVKIDGLTVSNPAGFSDRLMASAPSIYIDYDLGAFFRNKVHLRNLGITLKEFVVIRNPQGRLNINSISGLSKQAEGSALPGKPSKPKKRDVRIDVFQLNVGRVLYVDYTQLPPAYVEYPVNINERYENITDLDKLVKLIVTRTIINTAVSKLADLDFNKLRDDIVEQAIQGVTQELENIFRLPSKE